MYKISRDFIADLFIKSDPLVYGIAWKILKNEADVEECTQAFCVHALEKCVDRTVTQAPRKYMAVVAWNFIVEFRRKKKVLDVFDDQVAAIDQSFEILGCKEFLEFCMEHLSLVDRKVINIQLTELTPIQCAKKLGITVEAWQKNCLRRESGLKTRSSNSDRMISFFRC